MNVMVAVVDPAPRPTKLEFGLPGRQTRVCVRAGGGLHTDGP